MLTSALRTAQNFLEPWLAYRMRDTGLTGLSVAVLHRDTLVFEQAYGLADTGRATPLTTNHLFAAASQSKMATATAILQLAGKRRLRLDDAVHRYLPWVAALPDKRFQAITIHQLLTHTSGLLREGHDADYWMFTQPFPDEGRLRRLVSASLASAPGTTLKYSNLGFALLGQIVSAITGQSYTAYVHDHIITPLGLGSTYADFPSQTANTIATGYGPRYDGVRPALVHRASTHAFASVTGMHTTPADLCRFAAAYFPGNTILLSEQGKRQALRRQQYMADGYDAGRELGLGFERLPLGDHTLLGHGGHMGGHMSATFFDPKEQLAIAAMANCRDAPTTEITLGIFEAILFFATHAAQSAPADVARLNTRLHNPLNTIQIVATRDKIVAIDPDDWNPFSFAEDLALTGADTLTVTTDGNFFNQGEPLMYIFNRNAVQSVRYGGVTLWPD